MANKPIDDRNRLKHPFIPSRDERLFWLKDLVSQQIKTIAGNPVILAFSGGMDSTVLLHVLVSLRHEGMIDCLSALHIHHGLSDHADLWAQHCQSLGKQWQLPVEVVSVTIDPSSDIERQAREARYRVFEECVPAGGYLLMGHHQDDQAETVLFRLLRGSGLDGVAGMPVSRTLGHGVLLRPLLNVSKQAIEKYAESNELLFIEDESNKDQRFRRNFLRHHLLPQIEAVWPGVASRLARFSEDVSEVNQILLLQTKQYAAPIIQAPPSNLWGGRSLVDIKALQQIDEVAARRVVRYWLATHRVQMPDRVRLKAVFSDMIAASEDTEPVIDIDACYQLRRCFGKLVLLRKIESTAKEALEWHWEKTRDIELPCSDGRLSLGEQGGVCLPKGPLRILFRAHIPPGLKVAVKGRKGRKTIKRWLQDYQVPPWARDRIPFVFYRDELVALPGVFVTETYACEPHRGKSLSWQPDF